jgi:hypothetical protein
VRAGPRLAGQPDAGDDAVRIVGRRVERREVVDHLADGQLLELAGALQHDAHPGAPVRAGGARILAQDRDLARVARPVTLQDLHRRRLAGAVGAQQREHLAPAYVQIEPGNGGGRTVGLAQSPDGDGEIVGLRGIVGLHGVVGLRGRRRQDRHAAYYDRSAPPPMPRGGRAR